MTNDIKRLENLRSELQWWLETWACGNDDEEGGLMTDYDMAEGLIRLTKEDIKTELQNVKDKTKQHG